MEGDSLASARRIRQPIESKDDIANAFDGITYNKGQAVLEMFENFLGAAEFQKGVRHYMAQHAWQTATADDFLAALSEATQRDVKAAFSTFLDQPGVPLVSVALRCERGATPTLALSQTRYLPAGSAGSTDEQWQLPVCVKYGAGKTEGRECTLLAGKTGELALPKAKGCPEWVLANDREVGYYRVDYQGDLLGKLLAGGGKHLTLPERIGVLGDAAALVESGHLPPSDLLALVPSLLAPKQPGRHIIVQAAKLVSALDADLVTDALRPNYQRFVVKMFGARARALGFKARSGDDDDTRLLRPALVGLVARLGQDKPLLAEARKLTDAWLEDHGALDTDMVDLVLGIAAGAGDQALFDRLRIAATKAKDIRERVRLLAALGSFRDPKLVEQALALIITDQFEIRESLALMRGALADAATRTLGYEWVKTNYDTLAAKMPREYVGYLALSGGGFCDAEHRADVEAFFHDRSTKHAGAPRILAQVRERIDLCIAGRDKQAASIAAFLETY